MSEEKFSKCEEGKNVSVKFRVFGKENGNWKKSSGGKIKMFFFFAWKFEVKGFAGFVFTGWIFIAVKS